MTVKAPLRVVALLIAISLLGGLICLPVRAGEREDNTPRLLCRVGETEDGILEIEISLESKSGICAALCALDYNPESLIYLSGGACDENISFTAIDFGGELRFLLDSRQNTSPDCVLTRLYFKKTGAGKSNLSLACQDARHLGENREILTANVLVSTDGLLDESADSDNSTECSPPQIISQGVGRGAVSFSVKAAKGCFAAGARLFFTDLGGTGEHFEVLVLGVTSADGVFQGEYRFCPDGRYAVSVTALGYDRLGAHRGERTTVIFTPQN